MSSKFLTKSLFNTACVCPTKLYYIGRKNEYANQSVEDTFLLALADGGFQVGELAKAYFPGGIEMRTMNYETAEAKTRELLERENVVIFEAAVRFEDLFVRVDVLEKRGDQLWLIEVKSKSWDPVNDGFLSKDGTLKAPMLPYLYDIAFQKYVAVRAFPEFEISASLMLTDKTSRCPSDGLHQKIRIVKEDGRKRAKIVSELTEEDLSVQLLTEVSVDECCERIYDGTASKTPPEVSFDESVKYFGRKYLQDERIAPQVGSMCRDCEFRTGPEDEVAGLKSGFFECWNEAFGFSKEELAKQNILDLWNLRARDGYIQSGKVRFEDISEADLAPKKAKNDEKEGLTTSQRQWMQVTKALNGDRSYFIDRENLQREMESWRFPLHFIDFETATPAIPFNRGLKPYEGIAFQFSHHIVHENGLIEHAGEFLNTEPGVFPNFEFIRALKRELENDSGSVFRYAAHENSYVNQIFRQLSESTIEIPDRLELMEFIKTISTSTGDQAEKWKGERDMIDLLELVKRFYYDPVMRGSNSIKYVLPAILNSSERLRLKYSEPVYGAADGIKSLNFTDWRWVQFENGAVKDPYKLLPKMFADVSEDDLEAFAEDEIRDGGAAMTAYTRLQFEDLTDYQRTEIRGALLKYCELDTMAMVLIYEGWLDLISAGR